MGGITRKINATDLLQKSLKRHVAFVSGESFYAEQPKYNTMRLNFSCMDEEKINAGFKILGELIMEELKMNKDIIESVRESTLVGGLSLLVIKIKLVKVNLMLYLK